MLVFLLLVAAISAAPMQNEAQPSDEAQPTAEPLAETDSHAAEGGEPFDSIRVLDAEQLLQEVVAQGGNLEDEVKKMSDAEISEKMEAIQAEEAKAASEGAQAPSKVEATDEDHSEALEEYLARMREVLKSDHDLRKIFVSQETSDNPLADLARDVDHHLREEELRALRIERERRRRHLERKTVKGHYTKFSPFNAEEKAKWDDENASHDEILALTEKRAEALHYNRERREAFIEHEMLEEIAWRVELSKLNSEYEKKNLILKRDLIRERRESKLGLHPLSRAQLQEAWKSDGFDPQNWDPKTFFVLHDSSSDGYLDALELEALFYEQAKKLHGSDEIDEAEVNEEMARMREHVLKENDANKDELLSYSEFVALTLSAEFDTNEGWKALDARAEFSEKDLRNYIKKSLANNGTKSESRILKNLVKRATEIQDTKPDDDPEAVKRKLILSKRAEQEARKAIEARQAQESQSA